MLLFAAGLADAASYTTVVSQNTGGTTLIEISSDIRIKNNHGMNAVNPGSLISADDKVFINTKGYGAYGAYAYRSATILIGDSATITTSGDWALGAFAILDSTINIGDGAAIITSGEGARGVYANEESSLDIGSRTQIITYGDFAYGALTNTHSRMTIGDLSQITTSGNHAFGAYAYSNSSTDIGTGAQITTYGSSAYGAYADTRSSMTIGASSQITTSGNKAYGVYSNLTAKIEIGTGVTISTAGAESHAIYADSTSSIRLKDGLISATGADSFAVYSQNRSQVTGSGIFNITGDMYAQAMGGSTPTLIDFTLTNGSLFTGKTSYTSDDARTELKLTLNGTDTLWAVTGDSDLTDLYVEGATVDLTQAFGSTLTTSNLGQSDSDSGIFKIGTNIADKEAGLLIVTGDANGEYILDITNSGADFATGAEKIDLVLIESAGQSALFELDHIVESGGWQFDLRAPDRDTELAFEPGSAHQESAWYLYPTGWASRAGSGAINSFAGSYLMAYAETNTLMQRIGDLRDSEYSSGLWFRVHGGKYESNSKSYVRGFDMKYGGVQIGYDRKIERIGGGDIYAGAMFGYGNGSLDYSSEGSGRVDSRALGLYGLYIKPDGFYIDTVLKYQWMTNDFDVIDTAGMLARGEGVSTGGLGFSVEFGQRIPLFGGQRGGWYAEPQVQLSYQRQDGGYFNASNGMHIGVEPFTSLMGRLGLLVGYETDKTNLYAKVSKVKEFGGSLTIYANGVPIAESFAGSWWVYGLGFTLRINDSSSLYLDIERTSGGGFSQPWRIIAGWRVEF